MIRRTCGMVLALAFGLVVAFAPNAHAQLALDAGPAIGALAPRSVSVWLRVVGIAEGADDAARAANTLRCEVIEHAGTAQERVAAEAHAVATAATDGTMRFDLAGLAEGTAYAYRVRTTADGRVVAQGSFRTPRADAAKACIAFGSCADINDATASTWRAISGERPDALVLIGDTPYIDSTDLAQQRARYRAFATAPDFAALVASTPLYATWDDHDIGRNDTDGRLPGKENARQAFLEYRVNPSAGDGAADGIYTSFRHGPAEVFVLDTRWFAATEPSTQDAGKPTLLGERQWTWLGERLASSTRASGVVLVSGDIHRSRVLTHRTADIAGEDLVEIVTSPLHARAFSSGTIGGPDVAFDKDIARSYLVIDCDASDPAAPKAVVRIKDAAGTTHYERTIALRARVDARK
ncbi:MAG: alkaline phosphatase family protein [Planctomycetaceae bacterium]|nr:alkaline phosphatase family protein [Planctomycetaceae bacterium]